MTAGTESTIGLPAGLARLYHHATPARRREFVLVLGLMLLGAVAELVTLGAIIPFLALLADPAKAASYPALQKLFVVLGWSDPGQIVVPAAVLFAVVALAAGAIRLLLAWVSQGFVFRLGHDLSVEVYRRTLHQPYLYHVAHNTSDLIAAVNKVDAVVGAVLLQLMQIVTAAVIAVFIMAALLAIDPGVALAAALGFGLLYAAVTWISRLRIRRNSRIWSAAQGERVKTLQEGLGGIRDVIIDRTQGGFVARYGEVDTALRRAQASSALISAAPRFVIEAFGMVLIAVFALVLSRGPGGLIAALPVLGALALGAQRLLPLLQLIYYGWTTLASARHALSDVLAVLDLPRDPLADPGHDVTPLAFDREIVLDDVSFRYGTDRPMVIDRVSLVIARGARIGVIGRTGSGKSTIMDLVMGLLQPTSGSILIDGVPLTGEAVPAWQARIAHVPQAIYLADTTVARNIAFGVAETAIDMERVRRAAARAEIAGFIDGLPDGYATMVGERGIRLSGGQRQRLGIARALYKQADVLVFDEATSALDMETEAAVMDAIGSLDRSLTILLVTHRLSTVRTCDRIAVLENGRMIGFGSWEALSAEGHVPSREAEPGAVAHLP